MKTALFRFWQWTWGFPQTLLGAILYLLHLSNPHARYHGCIVTYWKRDMSLSIGMFLFLSKHHYDEDTRLLIHEYGHAIQSLFLGPLYLPIIGIPSILWGTLPQTIRMREDKGISYFAFYPERTANYLGAWVTGEPCDMV